MTPEARDLRTMLTFIPTPSGKRAQRAKQGEAGGSRIFRSFGETRRRSIASALRIPQSAFRQSRARIAVLTRNTPWSRTQRSHEEATGEHRDRPSDSDLSVISEQENRTVKKTVLAVGGLIVLGGLCYVGSSSGQAPPGGAAQTPAQPTQARTRIALLNLTYVIKNYQKYQHFQNEIKGIVEPFQTKDADLRRQLEELQKKAQAAPPPSEDLTRQAKEVQRRLEDNSAEAKLILGKRSDDEMKILFMDVYEAAQRYATSHDFELVLHYNDAVTKDEFLSAQNIARKLNTGALMPLYMMPSMDISQEVVRVLNSNVSTTGASVPTGQPAGR
jgi:Skp family chaperone for outer membrane proteins